MRGRLRRRAVGLRIGRIQGFRRLRSKHFVRFSTLRVQANGSGRVPGAEAHVVCGRLLPGLKSGPISETGQLWGGRLGWSFVCVGLLFWQAGILGGADEVGEEAVGAGDAFGELAVEGEAEVDPGAAAGAGDEQAAELGGLAVVVSFE